MNKRMWKKKRQQVGNMRELQECADRVNEISRNLHGELQELKKNQEKKYLLQMIRLREEKKRDIEKLQEKFGKVREEMREDVRALEINAAFHKKSFKYMEMVLEEQKRLMQYLKMDMNQFTDILEDNDVEIMDGHVLDTYDSNMMKPLKRIDTDDEAMHNKVATVYTSAYEWRGTMVKKMDVEVYIYAK